MELLQHFHRRIRGSSQFQLLWHTASIHEVRTHSNIRILEIVFLETVGATVQPDFLEIK